MCAWPCIGVKSHMRSLALHDMSPSNRWSCCRTAQKQQHSRVLRRRNGACLPTPSQLPHRRESHCKSSIMDCHEQDIYTNHDYKYRILDHLSLTKEKTPETRDEMALDNGSCEQNAELFGAFGFTSRLASWNTTRCSCCSNRVPWLLVLLSNTVTNNFWAKRQTWPRHLQCDDTIFISCFLEAIANFGPAHILLQILQIWKHATTNSCLHTLYRTRQLWQLWQLLQCKSQMPNYNKWPVAWRSNKIIANTHLDSSAWMLTAGKFFWDASFGDKTL